MLLRRPMVRDARNRKVPLIRHELLIPGYVNDERADRLARAADTSRLTREEKVRYALYSLITLPIVVAAAVLPPMLSRSNNWWTFLWFLPMAFVPVLVTTWVARRAAAHRIAAMYARAGICASCGYELADVPADADAVRTCPECGACWEIAA